MSRIVIASDFFHPAIGGAERQVRLLAAALADRGHDVRVVTVRQPGQDPTDRVDGVPVHRLDALSTLLPMAGSSPGRRFLPPLPDPRVVLGLRSLLGETPADVVHANGWIAYSCAAALEGSDVPLVLSVRDYGYSCAVRSLLFHSREVCDGPALGKCLGCAALRYGAPKAMAAVGGVFAGRSLLRRHVRGIHSVSRFVESIVRRDLLDGDRGWRPTLERIPDIVPAPERPRLGRAEASMMAELPREPYILFVGVLQPHKGVNVLLEAYERLRSGDVPLSGGAALSEDVPLPRGASLAADVPPLVLIGTRHDDTPERFPDGVTVLNDAPHSVVMAAWERSLFGVAPSIWPDPLPGVVREPMTVGRPVIATDIGGNPDMVTDGVNGLLVPPGDAAALAEAMRRLVEQPRLRDRLGAAARESVAGYTAPEIAACFEQLYARAAAG